MNFSHYFQNFSEIQKKRRFFPHFSPTAGFCRHFDDIFANHLCKQHKKAAKSLCNIFSKNLPKPLIFQAVGGIIVSKWWKVGRFSHFTLP